MLFQSKFDQFSYEEFNAFIRVLMEKHKFWDILFEPAKGLQNFTRVQRTHAAPDYNISHPDSFIGQWAKVEEEVRRVKFQFTAQNGSPDIEMTIDLDDRTISLDSAAGINPQEIKSALHSSFSQISEIEGTENKKKVERNSYDNHKIPQPNHVDSSPSHPKSNQRAKKKRYQVFICSTYTDLRTERQAAVEAVLKSGHIPAGMELFTAGDQSQMDVIRKWIDESDIFMLILGARYGTIEPKSGSSYIEAEFDYACSIGKPFFSIVMSDEGKDAKVQAEGRRAMEQQNEQEYRQFYEKVTSKQCSFFKDLQGVRLAVVEALPKIIESHPELIGWVSAAELYPLLSPEVERLSRENAHLQMQSAALSRELHQLRSSQLDHVRIELRKAVVDLSESSRQLHELMAEADASRQAVASARGYLKSGSMEKWKKEIQSDMSESVELITQVPTSATNFVDLNAQALESHLIAVYRLQSGINSLKEKYESSLRSDDEQRRQIAEDNGRSRPVKL